MKAKLVVGSILAFASAHLLAEGADDVAARVKADFHAKGIATMERLNQDAVQTTCSIPKPDALPEDQVDAMKEQQLATVRYPADGQYMGDWRKGEKLAQSGAGYTWSDKPGTPAGGNCYNCHRLSPKEISFGTMGPSLYGYGKRRGHSLSVQRDVFATIYNSKAFTLCSPMPRFGHAGLLSEEQIKDLVALLLDPESPLNSQ